MAIKVLLVDDIKSFNDHFSKMLKDNSDIDVVGTAESGAEAVTNGNRHSRNCCIKENSF